MPPSRRRTARRSSTGAHAVRLQKILADAGVASRRAAEKLIRAGRVSVNGNCVTRLGSTADPERDLIEVDGKYVGHVPAPLYYLLYKPRGVVTTTKDPHAKRTVNQMVPSDERLFPVGRLDAASEGLLLLTNDGASAHALLHPSFEVPRSYRVSIEGVPKVATLRRLREGVEVEGRLTAPCRVTLERGGKEHSVLVMELIEGRRRQIRLMLDAVGHPVRRLVRTRFGPLALGGLRPGEHRKLEPREVRALRDLVRAGGDTNRQQRR